MASSRLVLPDAGRPVDEEQPLGRRARRRRRRPGRRTARTPRSRAGAPSRGTRRAGRDRAVATPSSSPTWRADPAGLDRLGEQGPLVVAGGAPAAHVAEEVAADLDVGRGGDRARRTAAAAPRRPAGRSAARGCAGSGGAPGPSRPSGRCGSVRVTWHQAASAPRVRGVGEQLVEGAAQHGQRPLDRRLDVLDHRGAAGEVDQQAALGVRATRRTTSPRGSRCSARPVRPPGGRAGGPGRCSRRRRRRSGGTARDAADARCRARTRW